DLRAGLLAVGERDGDRVRAVDDVLVRGDVAVAVDHEGGALGPRLLAGAVAAAARPAEVVGRRAAAGGDLDVHDARIGALVDLVDGQAAARLDGGRGSSGGRGCGHDRRGRGARTAAGDAVDGGAARARRECDGHDESSGTAGGAPGAVPRGRG